MGIHIEGIIFSLIVLLPNFIFLFLAPRNVPKELSSPAIIFTVLERVGQVACFTLPILFGRRIAAQDINFLIPLMGVCLIIYYIGWIRFFIGGKEFSLLFEPLGFIPIPMAIFPLLYFILLGIWLKSYIFEVPAVLLSIGHLVNSWSVYKQIK
jgi:hypothetical protein